MEKEKCDYCEKEAKYEQILKVADLRTRKEEIISRRIVCENHKDFYVD